MEEHSLLREAILPHVGGKDADSLFDEENGPLGPEWYVLNGIQKSQWMNGWMDESSELTTMHTYLTYIH